MSSTGSQGNGDEIFSECSWLFRETVKSIEICKMIIPLHLWSRSGKKKRKTTPWTPPRKAKQETMKIRLFKAQPGVEQCYAEKQAQRNGEAQDGACLDITARSCSRWLKTQVYASAKRIPAKHNATPKMSFAPLRPSKLRNFSSLGLLFFKI